MKIEDIESPEFRDECLAMLREVAATGRSPEDLAKDFLMSGADAEAQARKFLQLIVVAQFTADEAARMLVTLVEMVGDKCPCPDCTGTAEKCGVN